jgi:hypothetical protein
VSYKNVYLPSNTWKISLLIALKIDLTGTKQKFKSNNQYSDCIDVEAGVIQEIVAGTNTVYHLQNHRQKLLYATKIPTHQIRRRPRKWKMTTKLAIDGLEKWHKKIDNISWF